MSAINQQRVTVVLRPRPDEDLSAAMSFLTLGSTVQIGRAGAVVASIGEGDQLQEVELLQNQVTLAEAAMRRGALMADQDHIPALNRVIAHIPALYLQVADIIRQEALDDGSDQDEAEEMAGQAIRALVLFKQNLEAMLEPDLLTTQTPGSLITENPVVAETPYAQVRVTDIGEWIKTVTNARRYEWLRDECGIVEYRSMANSTWPSILPMGAKLDEEIDHCMHKAAQGIGQ